MNDLDNELSRVMHRRADHLPGGPAAPLAFDDVRGKATSIRRRRQLAAVAGAVAAVAVIVPTAMFATQGTKADNPQFTTNTPTVVDTSATDPTPGPGPTMGPDPHALDVKDLPTGAPPAAGVLTEDAFTSVELEGATVRWTAEGIVVETEGGTFGPYLSSFGLVRNLAATAVAWTTDEGQVMAFATGSSEPFVVAETGLVSLEVGAITGTSCAPTDEAGDCLFYVSGTDLSTQQSSAFTLTPDGQMGEIDPDGALLNVQDATEDGRLIGHTEITDFGSCSGLFDPAESGSTPLWTTCDHTLASFSPNGDFVLADAAYGDGIGSGSIGIYDATTGELLADRMKKKARMAYYNSAVWEDESHVLFTAYQDGQWSVVRMGLDGAMEYAVEPQDGDGEQVPWHFKDA